MEMRDMRNTLAFCAFIALAAGSACAGAVFLTGHDPDFHATLGGNAVGAANINRRAISYVMDPVYNTYVAGGATKFLFVESRIAAPRGCCAILPETDRPEAARSKW